MPNGNGTGPAGAGPMTGRGLGNCSGSRAQSGQPFGRGRGMKQGFRNNGNPRGFCGGQGGRIAALEQKVAELSNTKDS